MRATSTDTERWLNAAGDPTRELVHGVIRFTHAFKRWIRRGKAEDGISWPRLQLLGCLLYEGPQKMGDLSEALEVTPRNITALVDALEHEGLVRRQPHPTDRRATLIELTPGAADAYLPIFEQKLADVSRVFERLSERDQRELSRLLGLLLESPELA